MMKHLARVSLALSLLTTPTLAASNQTGPAGPTSQQQQLLNAAIGNCTGPAYAGTGTPSVCSLLLAIYGQAVPTGTPGNPAGPVLTVQPPATGGTTQNTAPQSFVPTSFVSGTLANVGDIVSLSNLDGYNVETIEAIGSATWSGTTIVEMQPNNSSQWYTTKIGDYEGVNPGVSALPIGAAAQLFLKQGGVHALRIRAVTAIANGPLTINITGLGSVKDLRVSTTLTNPLSAQLAAGGVASSLLSPYPMGLVYNGALWGPANPGAVFNTVGGNAVSATNPMPSQLSQGNALLSLLNPLPMQNVVGGAAISSANPLPMSNTVGGNAVGNNNPLPSTAPNVTPQRSAALETCHQFTKATAASVMRSLAVSGQSASPLWIFLMDLAAAPSSGNEAAALLMAPVKMGSDGSSFQGAVDFSGSPVPSVNGLAACLSTTAFPTYTPAGSIGAWSGQVQ